MIDHLGRLLRDEDGPTAVEYAVMLAAIVAVCISTVLAMSHATADCFDQSATQLSSVLG
jgi:pilus assembly protein Flp/PilA